MTSGPQVNVSQPLEQLRSAALRNPGTSMNDQVLVEPELVTGARFDGQSDPRVPTHIADLAVLGQVPGHEFVTVEANPNDRDLRTPVGVRS